MGDGRCQAWRVEAKQPSAPWSGRSIVTGWPKPFGGPSAAECRSGGIPWGRVSCIAWGIIGSRCLKFGAKTLPQPSSLAACGIFSILRATERLPRYFNRFSRTRPGSPNVLRAPSCSCDRRAPSCDRHRCPGSRPRHDSRRDHGHSRPGLSGSRRAPVSEDPRHRVGIAAPPSGRTMITDTLAPVRRVANRRGCPETLGIKPASLPAIRSHHDSSHAMIIATLAPVHRAT